MTNNSDPRADVCRLLEETLKALRAGAPIREAFEELGQDISELELEQPEPEDEAVDDGE